MPKSDKPIRQSVALPSRVVKRVHAIAKTQRTSTNRVLVDLIEVGLESRDAEKQRFFTLADLLTQSSDPVERSRIKAELARMTFGQ